VKGPTWLAVLRDILATALGAGGILRMIVTNEVNTTLLIVCTGLLLGVPALNLLPLLQSLAASQSQQSPSTSDSSVSQPSSSGVSDETHR
jgi:hypothetical protein